MAADNRRRDQRVSLPLSLGYRVTGRDAKDMWCAGALANIGAGGLRFTCDRVIGEGDALEFRLRLPIRERSYYLTGTVMWATPLASGVDCGVAFSEMSADEQFELDELVDFLTTDAIKRRPAEDAE